MAAKEKDAEYRRRYDSSYAYNSMRQNADVMESLINWMEVPTEPDPNIVDSRIDACTDVLRERGLCSSVLNWHTRPKPPRYAEDDLPW